ncbi:TetR/AcrR family transcriptional regulator [Pseudonocardiaceae bacterium YIM PH 21723]|nr:TetR/AcrR family transcriptional regulator [Pseudonocardiaceae bacterium YIM PH 21723]
MTDQATAFRHRLLVALRDSIAEVGYRNTTVADIVRRAKTSRRTFYEHFASREECYVALMTVVHAELITDILAAVDRSLPWHRQVRQAAEAWIVSLEREPAIGLSWIRDVPLLAEAGRKLQRDTMDAFAVMIEELCSGEQWSIVGGGPISRQMTVMLLGGLRELFAATLEDGGRSADITETAVRAAVALMDPALHRDA